MKIYKNAIMNQVINELKSIGFKITLESDLKKDSKGQYILADHELVINSSGNINLRIFCPDNKAMIKKAHDHLKKASFYAVYVGRNYTTIWIAINPTANKKKYGQYI